MKSPKPYVNAAIFNPSRKLLLVRRGPGTPEAGKWCLPGGPLEGGKDWVHALFKEVRETVGLIVKRQRLFGIYSNPKLQMWENPTGNEHLVSASFLVTDFDGDVKMSSLVDDFDWFTEEKLPNPILKSDPVKITDAFAFAGEVFIR